MSYASPVECFTRNLLSRHRLLTIPLFFCSIAGNGSNSPAQNSTRSISPNTANNNNNNSNGHIIQPVSPQQTPLQLQTSSSSPQQSHHLLNNSVNLGNITPTFSSPQQVGLRSRICASVSHSRAIAPQTSLTSFKTSPLNGSGHHISSDINMPMPGAAVAPGTPNSTVKALVRVERAGFSLNSAANRLLSICRMSRAD